jgi:hypothetical protein
MGAFALYGRITYLASKTLKKYHVYAWIFEIYQLLQNLLKAQDKEVMCDFNLKRIQLLIL